MAVYSSEALTIGHELPRGSPLSPVLFNMHTVAVSAQQLDRKGRILSFADDVLVCRQRKNKQNHLRISCKANLIVSLPGLMFQKPSQASKSNSDQNQPDDVLRSEV